MYYLGIDSEELLEKLEQKNLLGRLTVTDTLDRAFEFGDVVLGIPKETVKASFSYSTKDESFVFLGHELELEEENEYEVKQVSLDPNKLSVHFKYYKDEDVTESIKTLEQTLLDKYKLKVNYIKARDTSIQWSDEEIKKFEE